MSWAGFKPILFKCQAMEARNEPSWPRCPVIAIVIGDLQLAVCVCFIKGVNGKFTPRPKMTPIGLFIYFWVYLNHQKLYHPILESAHKIETFSLKKIFPFKPPLLVKLKDIFKMGFPWINHQF